MNRVCIRAAGTCLFALTLTGAPLSRPCLAESAPQRIRIVLVGDSTVTDDSGWGTGFRRHVTGAAEVVNAAANGRSSKSFFDEGRWADALAERGQFYLIQFGHNDEPGKGPERETDPKTTYRANMTRYVDDVRAIGAKPVLVTSLVRRLYREDGMIRTTQTPYVEVVRAIATEKQVPLIDLHAISLADAENAGDDVWADLSPRDDSGQVDRTHLNAKGSEVVGLMVVEALRKVVPELAPLFDSAHRGLAPVARSHARVVRASRSVVPGAASNPACHPHVLRLAVDAATTGHRRGYRRGSRTQISSDRCSAFPNTMRVPSGNTASG